MMKMRDYYGREFVARFSVLGSTRYATWHVLGDQVQISVPSRARAAGRATHVFPNAPDMIVLLQSFNARTPGHVKSCHGVVKRWSYADGHGKILGAVFRRVRPDWEIVVWLPGFHDHGKGSVKVFTPAGVREVPAELYEAVKHRPAEKKYTMITNLTQHIATPDQVKAGVREPDDELKEEIKRLLTFTELPTPEEIQERANLLARIAHGEGAEAAMIGGAPYLMAPLERALKAWGIVPLYAFSRREVAEEPQPDGSIKKVVVFRHLGFVEV